MLSGFAQAAPFYEKVNLLSKKQARGGWDVWSSYFMGLRVRRVRAGVRLDAHMNQCWEKSELLSIDGSDSVVNQKNIDKNGNYGLSGAPGWGLDLRKIAL